MCLKAVTQTISFASLNDREVPLGADLPPAASWLYLQEEPTQDPLTYSGRREVAAQRRGDLEWWEDVVESPDRSSKGA